MRSSVRVPSGWSPWDHSSVSGVCACFASMRSSVRCRLASDEISGCGQIGKVSRQGRFILRSKQAEERSVARSVSFEERVLCVFGPWERMFDEAQAKLGLRRRLDSFPISDIVKRKRIRSRNRMEGQEVADVRSGLRGEHELLDVMSRALVFSDSLHSPTSSIPVVNPSKSLTARFPDAFEAKLVFSKNVERHFLDVRFQSGMA